jgi:hypothetical protein
VLHRGGHHVVAGPETVMSEYITALWASVVFRVMTMFDRSAGR